MFINDFNDISKMIKNIEYKKLLTNKNHRRIMGT